MKHLLIVFILLAGISASGQTDTLNRVNAKGKKDGYWKVFLDSMAFPTDSVNSYFCGYDLYDNGVHVFCYSDRNTLWKSYRFVYSGILPEKGSPVTIDGAFKWFDEKGRLINVEIFKEGKPLFWESTQYLWRDTTAITFKETIYFDKLYNNERGSFYFTEAYSDSSTQEFWHRKGKKGWKAYRIE